MLNEQVLLAASWVGVAVLLGVVATQIFKGMIYILNLPDAAERWLIRTLAMTGTIAVYLLLRKANGMPPFSMESVWLALLAGVLSPVSAKLLSAILQKTTGYDLDSLTDKVFGDEQKPEPPK